MRECIQKFDEDISMKCSKSDLLLMKNTIESTFISLNEWSKKTLIIDEL